MFYDTYLRLCAEKGRSPSRAAVEAGISKSLVSRWKRNSAEFPSPEVLRKLSSYFDVSIPELLIDCNSASPNEKSEIEQCIELLKTRPELREILLLLKDATGEEIATAIRVLSALFG